MDERDPEEHGCRRTSCYEGGISSFVEFLHTRKSLEVIHPDIIHVKGALTDGSAEAEVAMQYNDSYNELLISFANNIHTTDGGTHEEGFKRALTRVMNDYARKYNILKDGDKNLSGEDVREGLTAIISVKLKEAQFEGQTKAKLGNTEIAHPGRTIWSREQLSDLSGGEPGYGARAIFEKAMAASRAREAARKARELVRQKIRAGKRRPARQAGRLPEPATRRKREIYIVEGDSAGGSAKGGRDRKFQAILPLWGKMLNVEKARLDKVYGNDKLMPVITALGMRHWRGI